MDKKTQMEVEAEVEGMEIELEDIVNSSDNGEIDVRDMGDGDDDGGGGEEGDDEESSEGGGGGGRATEEDSDDSDTFDDLDTYQPFLFTPCSIRIPANGAVGRASGIALQIAGRLMPVITELRVWLQLKIPSYLEGDNLGHDIILSHHNGFVSCQSALSSLIRNIGQYRQSRVQALATLCTALPMNDDGMEAVRLLDRDIYSCIMYVVPNSVNMVLGLYDALGKNMAKIVQPREQERKEGL